MEKEKKYVPYSLYVRVFIICRWNKNVLQVHINIDSDVENGVEKT